MNRTVKSLQNNFSGIVSNSRVVIEIQMMTMKCYNDCTETYTDFADTNNTS